MANEKISIIVPVHNCQNTLNNCVESIVGQSYANLQIILVNNGSTDNSLAMCEEWRLKDDRITVINLDCSGVSKARNAGLEAITGEYFAFVDADDYVDTSTYEKLYTEAAKSNADIVFCRINEVKNGQTRRKQEKNLEEFVKAKKFEYFFLSGAEYVDRAVWRSLYRASALKSVRFDERLSLHEDFVFCMQCLKTTQNVAMVDEYLYNYSASENFNKKYVDTKYVENNKIALQYSIDFLEYLQKQDWADAIYFLWLIHTVVNLLRYNKDGKKCVKRLFNDEFWVNALSKNNYKAYVAVFKDKKAKIKYFLIKRKMFFLYKKLLPSK